MIRLLNRTSAATVFALLLLLTMCSATVRPSSTDYIVQAATTSAAAAAVEQAGGTVTRSLDIINAVAATLDPVAQAHLRANPHIALYPDSVVRSSKKKETPTAVPTPSPTAEPTPIPTAVPSATPVPGFRKIIDRSGARVEQTLLFPSIAMNVSGVQQQKMKTKDNRCTEQGITPGIFSFSRYMRGVGVTVAVVDTGFIPMDDSAVWESVTGDTGTHFVDLSGQCFVYHDFVSGQDPTSNSQDPNGHGTHVISTIANNTLLHLTGESTLLPLGIAPGANVVVARALGTDGSGSYSDVIAAIDWIVANKDKFNIRVLNLSLYAPVTGYYWEDPLNQAVMRAWQAGITVVTVAGNSGPEAGTITAPGNIPYVITVGAMKSALYTDSGLDELADYSARGPTESAFVKPDVVVPASRLVAVMPTNSVLAEYMQTSQIDGVFDLYYGIIKITNGYQYYQLSGTSMAAAEVSGIAALMLQANPTLTPDQVKYRLLSTARPAVDETTGEPRYSVWEQGAGAVDAEQAIFSTATEAANTGLDIALDLDPTSTEHYWGYTTWDETLGEFRLVEPDTGEELQAWDGGRRGSAGTWIWSGGRRGSAGTTLLYSGGRRGSAGTMLWAGDTRAWVLQAGAGTSSSTIGSELVINDE